MCRLQTAVGHRSATTGAAGIITALTGDTGWTLKGDVKGNGGLPTSWSLQTESGKDVSARNELVGSVLRLMDRSL